MAAAAANGASEVDALLNRIGLDKYSAVLASHGMFTVDDLRQPEAKGIIAVALPLGPKARLLKELNRSEGEASAGGDEYATLVQVLHPYSMQLSMLVGRLHDASKRAPSSSAGKHFVIATTTLKLCDSAIKDSKRYQALKQRSSRSAEADLASVKIAIGSAVRQLRMQQQQGILKSLEDADPNVILPTLDLQGVSIGAVSASPARRRSTPRRPKSSNGLDHSLLQRLRSFHNPPDVVSRTVLAFLRFFGHDEPSWAAARARLGASQLYVDLANFTSSDVSYTALTSIKHHVHDPDVTVELVKAASTDAGVLCAWVRQQYYTAAIAQGLEHSAPEPEPAPAAAPAGGGGYAFPAGGGGSAQPTPEPSPPRARRGYDEAPRRGSFAGEETLPQPQPAPPVDVPVDVDPAHLAQREQMLVQREEFIRAEERRLAAERARLGEMERALQDRERSLGAAQAQRSPPPPTPQPVAAPLPAGGVGDIMKQIDVLRGMLTAKHGQEQMAVDQEVMAKVNAVHRAAATSRALLAHFAGMQQDKIKALQTERPAAVEDAAPRPKKRGLAMSGSPLSPRSPTPTSPGFGGTFNTTMNTTMNGTMDFSESGGAATAASPTAAPVSASGDVLRKFPDPYPLGSQVKVSVWKEGVVTGHARGRVGVDVEDPATRKLVHVGAPACNVRLVVEEEVDKELYSEGCWVSVGNQVGRITGAARGRVGVELRNGAKLGVPPTKVKLLNEDAINRVKFPLGLTVVIQEEAVVAGAARGRVGLTMTGSGAARGALPEQLVKLPDYDGAHLKTLYPPGTEIYLPSTKETGTVVNCARGRVGIDVGGEVRGVLPDQIQRADSLSGVLVDFPIGTAVLLRGKQGEVTGHSRGRIGVRLDDGTSVGAVAEHLAVAELSDKELRQTYYAGLRVAIDGQRGKVEGVSRGRVGVVLDNGAKVGAMPDRVRILSADEVNRVSFPKGLDVMVNEEAVVAGATPEGMVRLTMGGAERLADPDALHLYTPVDEQIRAVYPTGTQVVVLASKEEVLDPKGGVIGTGRPERQGVVTGTSRGRIGVDVDGAPQGFLPDQIRRADSASGPLREFPVGAAVMLRVVGGEVTGHSRGGVGVETDDGRELGVLPEHLSMKELSQEEMVDKYQVGMPVRMSGETCYVTGVARGRIGVEFDDGRKQGALPEMLSIPTEHDLLCERFPTNHTVEVLQESCGVVVGKSRGRVGVLTENGRKIGVMADQLTRVIPTLEESYPVTTSVRVTLPAKVTGYSRGRVGVQLKDGTNVGVLPDALVRVHCPEDFIVGCIVLYQGRYARVTGHSRGRVGIQFQNGDRKGVVPSELERVKQQVAPVVNLKSLCRGRKDGLQIGTLLDMALDEHQTLVADIMCAVNGV